MQIQHKPGSFWTEIRCIQKDTAMFLAMIRNEMETARERKSVARSRSVEEKVVPQPDGKKGRRDTHIGMWAGANP